MQRKPDPDAAIKAALASLPLRTLFLMRPPSCLLRWATAANGYWRGRVAGWNIFLPIFQRLRLAHYRSKISAIP